MIDILAKGYLVVLLTAPAAFALYAAWDEWRSPTRDPQSVGVCLAGAVIYALGVVLAVVL